MKNAYPHTGKWLREWFPEQTKSIPSIIVWTIIYILDVGLVFWLAAKLGISILDFHHQTQTVVIGVYLVIALALFWLETAIYNRITKAIRDHNTLD